MTYEETLEYLFTRLPMYQRIGKKAYKKDLTNTIELLEHLDNPHEKFKNVHIAGTNGKGTSAHGIAAILQSAGYKTGLYTSPHLKNFTERIKIDGQEVDHRFVIDFIQRLKQKVKEIEPSFFEITVAMAFEYFANQKVDIAVIETGLGGRLDSTNVIIPEVSLITNIGWDHMDMLGDTLAKIAAEKAGIIKKEVPVVIGETLPETKPVFEAKAKQELAPIYYPEPIDWTLNKLTPDYIRLNLPAIIKTCELIADKGFEITPMNLREGIEKMNELTGLKGRFQILSESPLTIADVSHNPDGLKILFNQIKKINKGKLHLIFGTVKDKDLSPIFELFPNDTIIYWTESKVPRALKVEELAIQGVVNAIQGECYKDVNEAIEVAKEKARADDLILITGSTFIIGEIENI